MFSCVVFPGSFRNFIPKTLRCCFSQSFTSFPPTSKVIWFSCLDYIRPVRWEVTNLGSIKACLSQESDGEMSHLTGCLLWNLKKGVYIFEYQVCLFLRHRCTFMFLLYINICIYVSQFILWTYVGFGNTFGIKNKFPLQTKAAPLKWRLLYSQQKMAQNLKGRLVENPYKPICRDCAMYFSSAVFLESGLWFQDFYNFD